MRFFRRLNPLSGLRRRNVVRTTNADVDLVRACFAEALAESRMQAPDLAAAMYGENSRAHMIAKTAVPALVTSQGTGAQLIGTDVVDAKLAIFNRVVNESLIGKVGFRRVPFRTGLWIQDEDPVSDWVDEASGYRTTPIKGTRLSPLEPFKVGTILVASNEQIRDSSLNFASWATDRLVTALAQKLDQDLVDSANSGSNGVKPASITSGAGSDSPSESFGDMSTFTGDPQRTVALIHPWTAFRLTSAARPDVGIRGGTLNGMPVFTSAAVAEEEIILVDPAAVAVALSDAEVVVSTQANIDMQDSTSMKSGPTGSVAAVNTTSMWSTNSSAFRATVLANWKVVRPDAVAVFNIQQFGFAS